MNLCDGVLYDYDLWDLSVVDLMDIVVGKVFKCFL